MRNPSFALFVIGLFLAGGVFSFWHQGIRRGPLVVMLLLCAGCLVAGVVNL